ncbi:hypothetical protein BP5796_06416 [Coleophoma crateriformis]|uniref:HIT-type domain-containing protein n=1 Tax=Coleophoma crateriformis TaxID=565419 RepID=A0A3D8RNL1_9HELO|nr:hypothetical protein BP5796_06416 [Coleophoma crateriformis]
MSLPECEDEEPKVPAVAKLCGVCNMKESKYKCTRCFLPYCSVTCSTKHRASHPAIDTTPAATPELLPAANSNRPSANASAGTKGYRDPFTALDDSEQLKELFKMFPNLSKQLNEVYSATLPPLDTDEPIGLAVGNYKKGPRREVWNRDKGTQNGIQALCRARETYGRDGEGVREFSRLVLQIVSGEDNNAAVELIEKEIAEENAKIIQQLLEANS